MNSHQRRKASRRAHMLLPLGKQVEVRHLIGRNVYVYGRHSRRADLTEFVMFGVIGSGEHAGVDLTLSHANGTQEVIRTSARGLRLVNPTDSAPRPWWVETKRRHVAEAKARKP